jgi:uncharacterized protein YbaR (Trm112 family)/SAM-dependent methyltransferase
MRYGLLDLAACQHCHGPLTSFTARECASGMPQALLPAAARVASGPGAVGPVPADAALDTPIGAILRRHASPAADPARNFAVEIEDGLLVCAVCGRWYPIAGQLPEILPDHLRDRARDQDFFASLEGGLPPEIRDALRAFVPGAPGADAGAHYKSAEMAIAKTVDDPAFFGPGHTMPFNPWNPEFTLFYVRLFGIVSALLAPRKGDVIVDSGCGYAWTSEWLHRSGLQTVGVDIARVYLEIGIARMGPSRPHLIVGDVESLPLAKACADAVLACESFHHVPDRPRAMAGYDRILRKRGRIVLAEPDERHETSDVAVGAMAKHGILERGMSLADVRGYVAGTTLTDVERLFVPALRLAEIGRVPSIRFVTRRQIVDGNLFVISRPVLFRERVADLIEHRHEYWLKLKRRISVGWK